LENFCCLKCSLLRVLLFWKIIPLTILLRLLSGEVFLFNDITMKFTNKLINETSPYLLQHAHNPVNWYPWSEEAFEKATKENKPVLVSIGYSTCHWCHVMERESFENEEVAEFMNAHFINIKVDREERPDIDSIYMEAVQIISGHGGWPLNCFLLPDKRPFFGGTYFPPRQAHGRASWMMVLKNIHNAYQNRYFDILSQAEKLTNHIETADDYFIKTIENIDQKEAAYTSDEIRSTYGELKNNFDSEFGGFGHAPKFPSTMSLRFCLDYFYHTKDSTAMAHLQLSLDAMIYGGIYDQIGGGFSRYSVDNYWLVPHFEKMLYDNALLVDLLADVYKLTKKSLYKDCIEETLDWVLREMTDRNTGFYSALDADSEGVEGKFYVWQKDEIETILGVDAALFCDYYNVSAAGNWEETNILHRRQSLSGYAAKNNLSENDLKIKFKELKNKILAAREDRIRPSLDNKIILSWNALMCKAIFKANQALGEKKYLESAQKNLNFLLNAFSNADKSFKHIFHEYQNNTQEAFLDDYAHLIDLLLLAYQTTAEKSYLEKAEELTKYVLKEFWDEEGLLFFYTSARQKDVIVRKKDLYDNALPSGNSSMIYNMISLAELTGKEEYKNDAFKGLYALKKSVLKYPQSFANWLKSMLYFSNSATEIAIVGKNYQELLNELLGNYIPNLFVSAAEKGDENLPLLQGRYTDDENTKIYVCKNYSCQLPVKSVEAALNQI
jgi:uncharacterized protein YyaL (SSP411 family)